MSYTLYTVVDSKQGTERVVLIQRSENAVKFWDFGFSPASTVLRTLVTFNELDMFTDRISRTEFNRTFGKLLTV